MGSVAGGKIVEYNHSIFQHMAAHTVNEKVQIPLPVEFPITSSIFSL